MKFNLQRKEDATVDREIAEITVDDEGTLLLLKFKGLHDPLVCADVLDKNDTDFNKIKVGDTTKKQFRGVVNSLAIYFERYLVGWNVPELEVNKKNIKLFLNAPGVIWVVRQDFIDLVSEASTGIPRSQKELEVKNFMSLAGRGSSLD